MSFNRLQRLTAYLIAVVLILSAPVFVRAEEPVEPSDSQPVSTSLTAQEIEDKASLSDNLANLMDDSADVAYEQNRFFAECSDESEAEELALAYQERIGHEVHLIKYSYGIATYEVDPELLTGAERFDDFEETTENYDVVTAVVELASDLDNDLSPVYPVYEMELEYEHTEHESFSDPLITETSNTKYQWYHEMLGSKYVWKAQENGLIATPDDITVAVIDTGVNAVHEDFCYNDNGEEKSVVIESVNFHTESDSATDGHGHGTNVAGLIAAVANDKGGRGVASGVRIANLRVTNSGGSDIKMDNILSAINYCVENRNSLNIRVISISISGTEYVAAFDHAIENAHRAGIVICAAAGNQYMGYKRFPASYNGVISVGALNSHYEKSIFSNYGESVTISAPGGDLSTGKYGAESLYAPVKSGTTGYSGMCGTSQATPVVSGVCAQLIAQNPSITPEEVEDVITGTATPLSQSYRLGAGCINLAAAMEEVTGLDIIPEAPTASIPDGSRQEAFGVTLAVNDPDSFEGCVFYTLDGTDPNPQNTESTYEYDYKNEPTILLTGDNETESVTLKAVSMLYGRLSEVATYRYYYTRDVVTSIEITAENGLTGGPVNTQIQFEARVLPAIAQDKRVIWTSSDPTLISIDENGLATINRVRTGGSNQAIIRGAASDGSGIYDEYVLTATTPATAVELNLTEQITLKANLGEIYDLGGDEEHRKWRVWPDNALQQVLFSSSNTRVATVDADGVIRAVSSGTAVITVSAADGSGKKDTVKVQCTNTLNTLSIQDSAGLDFISAGGKMVPACTMNNGESLPDDTRLIWELKNFYDTRYVSINSVTGVVTAKSNRYIEFEIPVTVRAYSPVYLDSYGEPVSAEYTFSVFPRTQKLALNYMQAYIGSVSVREDASLDLLSLIEENSTPRIRADRYRFAIGNPDVLEVRGDGSPVNPYELYGKKSGSSKVTMTALDGSGKKLTFTVRVYSGITVKSLGNVRELRPGGKIQLNTYMNDSIKLKNGTECFYQLKTITSKYLQLNPLTGVVTMKTDYLNSLTTRQVHQVRAVLMGDSNEIAEFEIEICPTGITEVRAKDYYTGEDVTRIDFTERNQQKRVSGYTLPAQAVQGWFTYESSNAKVATVDSRGVITALRNGTAVITAIPSGTVGKKAKACKIPVTVNYPKAQMIEVRNARTGRSISSGYLRTEIPDTMLNPPGAVNQSELDLMVNITPIEAMGCDVVSSSNEKVATVSRIPADAPDNPYGYAYWKVLPKGTGSCKLNITADDGSKIKTVLPITVQVPVTNPTLASKTGQYTMAATGKLTLVANPGEGVSNKKMTYAFYGTPEEVAEMEEYASLNSKTGVITAKKAAKLSTTAHILKVVATAADDWHASTSPVAITLKPGIVYMNRISVNGKDGVSDLATGVKLTMQATTNLDATDRKIIWSIAEEDRAYATISAKGVLKGGAVSVPTDITVIATAVNGPDPENPVVGSCRITVWPAIHRIQVDSEPASGVFELYPGEELNLKAVSVQANGDNYSCNKYKVTYTTGCGKVFLRNAEGNQVRVCATKRGTIKVKFAALDGSGKKTTVILTVK